MSSSEDNPCYGHGYDCPRRKLGCHTTCKEHKDWLAEQDKKHKDRTEFFKDHPKTKTYAKKFNR